MAETLKHKAVNGVLWRIAEQGGKQVIQFGISVILARLIMPDQFGMVAMLTVFMAIADVFIDSGFSTALIRKNDRTPEDCSTVYWFNILISVGCYFILYLLAPLIAKFYNMMELSLILRVSSLGFVISSFAGVHRTLLQLELDFKSLAKFNILAVIISGCVGVIFAYLDFKVWALVLQGLMMHVVNTVCVLWKVNWRPIMSFSTRSLKEFFSFGSKILASSLLDSVYNNIYSIVIGKAYKASSLAFYNRASNLTALTSSMPSMSLQSVLFPALCKLQADENALRNGYCRALRLSAFVVFPLCLGIGAVANPLIVTFYTERWIYVASLLSILVFSQMWFPIHLINLSLLEVKGRSDLFFRLEIIKKIQGVLILCLTFPFGLEAMCYGSVFCSILSLIWNTHYTGIFLKMSIITQLKDIAPTFLLSIFMFVISRFIANIMGNNIISLICAIIVGAFIYISIAVLTRFPQISELKNIRK